MSVLATALVMSLMMKISNNFIREKTKNAKSISQLFAGFCLRLFQNALAQGEIPLDVIPHNISFVHFEAVTELLKIIRSNAGPLLNYVLGN